MNNEYIIELVNRDGVSHIERGKAGQDSVEKYQSENIVAVALADGIGSLKNSKIASQQAVTGVCNFFEKHYDNLDIEDNELKEHIISYVHHFVQKSLDAKGITWKDADCTLVFGVILKDKSELITCCIGDSAVCVIDKEKSYVITNMTSTSGSTLTLDSVESPDDIILERKQLDDSFLGLILTSDGLENELYYKISSVLLKSAETYFNAMLKEEKKRSEIINQRLDQIVNEKDSSFDDDISLAIVSRATSPITLKENPTWLCKCGKRNSFLSFYCPSCYSDRNKIYYEYLISHQDKPLVFRNINDNKELELKITGLGKKEKVNNKVSTVSSDEFFDNPSDNTGVKDESKEKVTFVKESEPAEKAAANNPVSPHKSHNPDPIKHIVDVDPRILTKTSRKKQGQQSKKTGAHRAKSENKNSKNRNLSPLKKVLITSAAVVVVVAGGAVALNFFHPTENTDEKDSQKVTTVTQPVSTSDTTEKINILDDGSKFWGNLVDNKPNGYGVLLEDGQYYIGEFINGDKTGTFTVVSYDGKESNQTNFPENHTEYDTIPNDASTETTTASEVTTASEETITSEPTTTSETTTENLSAPHFTTGDILTVTKNETNLYESNNTDTVLLYLSKDDILEYKGQIIDNKAYVKLLSNSYYGWVECRYLKLSR